MPSNVVNANDPTSYVLGHINPPRVYLKRRPPLPTDSRGYKLGDIWIDMTGDDAFMLVDITTGIATWVPVGGTPGTIGMLTGDVGAPVFPVANNINIQGGASGAISFSNGGAGQMDAAVQVDGTTITIVGNQLVASSSVTWLDSAGGPLALFKGYFATAAAVYTLPAGVANGNIVEIVDQVGGGVIVTASGADIIQISMTASSAGGTATSTKKGDALRLVFRLADLTWYCVPSAAGIWILA